MFEVKFSKLILMMRMHSLNKNTNTNNAVIRIPPNSGLSCLPEKKAANDDKWYFLNPGSQ